MANDGLLGFPRGAELPSGLLGMPLGQGDAQPARLTAYNQEPAQTYFTLLAAPAGANTKATSWTTMASYTDHDADGFYIGFNSAGTQSSFLVDIAYGPSGGGDSTLTVVLENLCFAGSGGGGGGSNAATSGLAFIPARIPAGSRIAGRVQCSTGSQTVRVPITIAGGGFYSILSQYCREGTNTYVGVNTAASRGTQVDPGGSAGSKGAWAELGRLERNVKALVVCVNQENSAPSSAYFRLDIARGTQREVILPDYAVATAVGTSNTGEGLTSGMFTHPIFCELQAGDILAARLQSSITDATDRILHVSAAGFA